MLIFIIRIICRIFISIFIISVRLTVTAGYPAKQYKSKCNYI